MRRNIIKRLVILTVCLVGLQLMVGCGASYGTEMSLNGENTFYYTSNVTKEESTKVVNYLIEQKFLADDAGGTVQLDKKNNAYLLRLPVKTGMEQDAGVIEGFKALAQQVSYDVFSGSEVDIDLCNDKLETLRTVVSTNYGTRIPLNGNNTLYYTSNVTKEESTKLVSYLTEPKLFSDDAGVMIQIDKSNVYLFNIPVKKGMEQDAGTIEGFKVIGKEISDKVFSGSTVDINLCNDNLEILRTVVY